jgi:hypothetical protein
MKLCLNTAAAAAAGLSQTATGTTALVDRLVALAQPAPE